VKGAFSGQMINVSLCWVSLLGTFMSLLEFRQDTFRMERDNLGLKLQSAVSLSCISQTALACLDTKFGVGLWCFYWFGNFTISLAILDPTTE
jgi:hypothetical protein